MELHQHKSNNAFGNRRLDDFSTARFIRGWAVFFCLIEKQPIPENKSRQPKENFSLGLEPKPDQMRMIRK